MGAPRCLTTDVERVINPQIYSDGDSLTAAGMPAFRSRMASKPPEEYPDVGLRHPSRETP